MSVLVIKIGTNVLTTESGTLDVVQLSSLAGQIARVASDRSVVIVTSASITCGSERLNMIPETIPEKQASAAVGQFLLMKEYDNCFNSHGIQVAQILLTQDGLEDSGRRQHVKNTISTLFSNKIIPIINENDSVSTEEIQFGDNDTLSSQVAALVDADQYIILTDTDGLFTKNPKLHTDAEFISEVPELTDDIFAMADSETDSRSKGGMISKLHAAQKATQLGIQTIIANGRQPGVITDVVSGVSAGTRFLAKES